MAIEMVFEENEVICWYDEDGMYHNPTAPAVITIGGEVHWMKHGQQHREDGPSSMYPNGKLEWCLNGIQYLDMDEYLYHLKATKEVEERIRRHFGR